MYITKQEVFRKAKMNRAITMDGQDKISGKMGDDI